MEKEMLLKMLRRDVNNKNIVEKLVKLIKHKENELDLAEFIIFYEDLKEEYGDRIWEFVEVDEEFKELNNKYYFMADIVAETLDIAGAVANEISNLCKSILDVVEFISKESSK